MTPSTAVPVFVVSIAVMLAASALFAQRLDHIGLPRPARTLLGFPTALAADARDLSASRRRAGPARRRGRGRRSNARPWRCSGAIAGHVKVRHEALEEALVGPVAFRRGLRQRFDAK
jgi:hypothetical protein